MKTFQACIKDLENIGSMEIEFEPQLLLLFVSPEFDKIADAAAALKAKYPNAILMGCSTAGEIKDVEVVDNSVIVNAISFEHTTLKYESVQLADYEDSQAAGQALSKALKGSDLKHIIVLSDGLKVNGADLVVGLNHDMDSKVSITGGLAGDSSDFNSTFLIDNGEVVDGRIIGLGMYGSKLKVGYGSKGGWDSFGIEREVTKSDKNVLYELDGEPALKLYKSFLGDKAKDLPGSGLLFPLSMRENDHEPPVVRTILAVDEAEQSLTFAGNLPEGNYVRLMKANVDRLIVGAEDSADDASNIIKEEAQFALLISCVGRRLVLKQMVEEELEVVRDHLGKQAVLGGFYSYGEIAPFGEFSACRLHNQTMTITTFAE